MTIQGSYFRVLFVEQLPFWLFRNLPINPVIVPKMEDPPEFEPLINYLILEILQLVKLKWTYLAIILPMYRSSPAYTIPKQSPPRHKEKTPSPNKYYIKTKYTVKRVPAWKIGTAKKHAVRYGNGNLPGPFDYSTDKSAVLARAPRFRMGEKLKTQRLVVAPGPATYLPFQESVLRRTPKIVFTKQARKTIEVRPGPGPGDYNPYNSLDVTKTSAFSSSRRFDTLQKLGSSRSRILSQWCQKGNHSPSYRFGTERRLLTQPKNLKSPGPTDYKINLTTLLPKPEGGTIGKERRINSDTRMTPNPGPGDYNISNNAKMHSFSLSKSLRPLLSSTMQAPGPADYSPRLDFSKQSNPRLSFPKSGRLLKLEQTPSPWTYNYKLRPGNGITFAKERRRDTSRKDIPAPNSYNIPSAVAVVPPYQRVHLREKSTDRSLP